MITSISMVDSVIAKRPTLFADEAISLFYKIPLNPPSYVKTSEDKNAPKPWRRCAFFKGGESFISSFLPPVPYSAGLAMTLDAKQALYRMVQGKSSLLQKHNRCHNYPSKTVITNKPSLFTYEVIS
jgi:hypothetical protein